MIYASYRVWKRGFGLVLIGMVASLAGGQAQPLPPAPPQGAKPFGVPYDFFRFGPYRRSIPQPATVLGYEIGATHSTFRDQERVVQAIAAAAKDRVRVVDYGKSVEGRPLRLVLVSSPDNLSKLERIRTQIGQLADPRTLATPADAEPLIRTTPCFTWISHCIHGDETASFETAMMTLYTLAASEAPEIMEALKQSVVILNPVFNPDGHERFVVYYNSVAVGSPEGFAFEKERPWAAVGRFNHYRFDMNRDKVAMSQPETRQESAAFLHWHPQVYVDQHGQPEIYFFPPNSLPANRQTDRARVSKWTDLFGRANAAAFDRYGWQYVTRETYDFFYPGYLDTWATLSGAIGMTYETDGGGNLARRRNDNTISTLRDATAHHFETALSTIQAAAKNRESLLRDYYTYRHSALEPSPTEKTRRIILLSGSDPGRAAELATLLIRSGVEVREATAPFQSTKAVSYWPSPASGTPSTPNAQRPTPTTFPKGTLFVDLAQPQGRMARALLEPDPDFEPEFVKEQLARRDRNAKRNENEPKEGYEFYDTTAWSLPYAFDLEAYGVEEAPPLESHLLALNPQGRVVLTTQTGGVVGGKTQVAYLFRYDRNAAALLALQLLQEDFKLAAATKPVRAGGKTWPVGTLIAFVSRNPETLHARIESLAKTLGVEVQAVHSAYGDDSPVGLGSDYIVSLKKPQIAVVADDTVFHTSFGAVWHLLERVAGVQFTAVRLRSLRPDVLAQFNVLILPEGFNYAGTLGKGGIERLKEWVSGGRTLLGLGSGGLWFLEKEVGLSSATVVGEGESKPDEKTKPKKPLSLPGAIFRAKLDPNHFLGYGYERGEIAVPLDGDTFLKPSTKGANPLTFGKGNLKLSGFVWPDNTETLLAETAYVLDEPMGGGHALLYLNDPTARALWPGLRRLFLSGLLFGPSASAFSPNEQRE